MAENTSTQTPSLSQAAILPMGVLTMKGERHV